MPAHRLLPSDSILAKWVDEGLTHQQIVDRIKERDNIEVSRSAVSVALSRAGLTTKVRYTDWIPWPHINSAHNQANEVQQLRLGARLMYAVGSNQGDEWVTKFTNWVRRLRDLDAVVYYNPEHGFGLTKARPQDKGVVRYPRGVRAPGVEAFVDALLAGASLTAGRKAAKAATP